MVGIVCNLASFSNPFFATICLVTYSFYRPGERFLLVYPMASVTIIGSVVVFFMHKPKRKPGTDMEVKLLLYLMCYIILTYMTFFRWDIDRLPELLKSLLLPGLMLFALTSNYINSVKRMLLFSQVMVLNALLICMDALHSHFMSSKSSADWYMYHKGGRLVGFGWWGNANEFAHIANLGLSFLVLILFVKKDFFTKIAAFVLVPIFLLSNFLSGSRAGVLSLAIFFSTLLLFSKRKFLGIFCLSMMVPAMIVLLVKFQPQRADKKGSTDARKELLYDARREFYRRPIIGIGYRRFTSEIGKGHNVHNTYMQALVEFGLLGSYFFFRMMYLCYRGIYNTIKETKTKKEFKEIYTITYCYGAILFSSGIYYFFGNQLLTFSFLTIAGASVSIPRIYTLRLIKSKNKKRRRVISSKKQLLPIVK